MKSKLFISLSAIALIGVSIATHAAMIKYMENDTKVPKGDCLEMMCEHGCVEEEGSFIGHCCPSGGSYGQSCNHLDACCQGDKGLVCSGTSCACSAGKVWMDGKCCLDVGCGCDVARTAEGCCPGVVKGCDGVCGSGKTNVGCGCGVVLTAEGCCPGVVKGCDGICGSGKTDAGCGCGVTCPRTGGGGGGLTARPCPSCGKKN